MGIRTLQRDRCIVCGSGGAPLYANLTDCLFGATGTWGFMRCVSDDCGVLWLSPAPAPDELPLIYANYYTHEEPSTGRARMVVKWLYRGVVDALLMMVLVPVDRQRTQSMFLQRQHPGRLLDVGCGQGTFLARMAKRGWEVTGIDFDAAAIAAARSLHGLNVSVGTLNDLVQAGKTFDVITASHVLEHLHDPDAFFESCRHLLVPGGKLILRTPNIDSIGHRLFGRDWRGLEPPRHLWLFNMQGLAAVARRSGFSRGSYFTTAAGAETILSASFLMARGVSPNNRWAFTGGMKLLGPPLAILGKVAWLLNRRSGEELCAILTNEIAA